MPQNIINLGRVKGSIWYSGTADTAEDISAELSAAGNTPLGFDLYMNAVNGNVYQYVSVSGVMTWLYKGNLRGVKGEPFSVAKTYQSVSAMNDGYSTDGVPVGGFVLIDTGNVEDEDNAKLYYKGAGSYVYLTDLSGAQGIKGDQGEKGETGADGKVPTLSINADGELIATY